ncbi:uncharacterized protein LOC110675527 [Aedes aegypti]|uniref:Uncharacterized protein n=1 Tax=Aedes aegypti TaxID=7159 RepID=A0A6I8TTM6_AEDAE|nr:uncharacterized protein LOC110675527 [Aedes aegypti]
MDSEGVDAIEEHRLTIDDFPNEVFERIISYLNAEDRKVASLVNYRWSQFCFSRIALGKVQLELNCAQRSPRDYWTVLEKSSRCYRNVLLKFASDDEGYLLRILDKFKPSLERVSIEQDADARLLHTEISSTYLSRMLEALCNVKELTIKTIIELSDSVDGTELPRLELVEAVCLYTHCMEGDWIDWARICPNAKYIGVPLQDGCNGFPRLAHHFSNDVEHLSIDARFVERDSLDFIHEDFPQLKKFRFLYPISNSSAAHEVNSFISRCSNLTEISLFINSISQEVLQIIAESCTQLQVVSLDTNEIPQSAFSILSKLPLLRQLVLHKMTVEPAMITSALIFPALCRLTCLSIRINCPDAFHQVHKKMPLLTELELLDRFRFGISNFNQNGVVAAICTHMRNVRRLALVDWAILDLSIFGQLNMLTNLTELRLKCIGLNANKAIPCCAGVRKLILDVDSLKSADTIPLTSRPALAEIISEGFPGLKSIELRKQLLDKTKCSEQEIFALRSIMTDCAFYRRTRLSMSDKDYAALL